jgi:hypothetical protein
MTKALQNVFNKLNLLSEKEQDIIAALITDELNWDNKFKTTKDKLSWLANEAKEEYKKNETKPWDLK